MRFYVSAIIWLLMASSILVAQDRKRDYRKLHYLSEEEMNSKVDLSRGFTPTDPPSGIVRNVAEFDQMQSVLVRYPFGVPVELIREMAENTLVTTIVANAGEQQTVINTYTNSNVNLDNCAFLIAPTDSYWVRDYGPWFVFDGDKNPGIVDFPYNRPRPNDNNIPSAVAENLGIDLYGMNLISTGGNYMCDGMGKAASTDLVWEENPGLTQQQVGDYVSDYLGNPTYLVTSDPLGDYIKHIDCWGKFLSPGKILLGQVPPTDNRYQDFEDMANYFANTNSSYGYPYEVVRVFTPGTYPNTPYTNSLILNKKVFVPITGSQWDDEALAVYEEAMPGYEIIGVMYNGWENTDALHCRTKGIADLGMLYIKHYPILGDIYYSDHYEITAEVIAYSGESVYQDSVFIYYRTNSGDYTHTLMTQVDGDTYTGTITGINQGDLVEYYLFAADASGRRSFSPYIGQPDPFEFQVATLPGIDFNPDSVLFTTMEEMLIGLPLHLVNNTSSGLMISSITEMGEEFLWYVEEMPQLPLFLSGNDSLSLNILCEIPVKLIGDIVVDTLYVTTVSGVYPVPIMIDSDLLISGNVEKQKTDFILYPNPASTHIQFAMSAPPKGEIHLSLYRLTGELVVKTRLQANGMVCRYELPADLSSGTYLYEITDGYGRKTGRLVVIK